MTYKFDMFLVIPKRKFIIIVYKILLNITQNKIINWSNNIPKMNGDRCMRSFNSITVCYIQYLYM